MAYHNEYSPTNTIKLADASRTQWQRYACFPSSHYNYRNRQLLTIMFVFQKREIHEPRSNSFHILLYRFPGSQFLSHLCYCLLRQSLTVQPRLAWNSQCSLILKINDYCLSLSYLEVPGVSYSAWILSHILGTPALGRTCSIWFSVCIDRLVTRAELERNCVSAFRRNQTHI